MFNKKTDECIYTFMSPFENKLTAKTQILSSIDAAIVNCEQITPEVGETLVLILHLYIPPMNPIQQKKPRRNE